MTKAVRARRPGANKWAAPVLTALLLNLSFPGASLSPLAWAALIPFFRRLNLSPSLAESVRLSFVTGLFFFSISIFWLRYVAVFGWIFVAFVLTAFFTLFGVFHYAIKGLRFPFVRAAAVAAAWMTVEIIRTECPVFGLGWNLLAYSQASHLSVIQSASFFGAYGLGFLIAFVNALIAEALTPSASGDTASKNAFTRRRAFLLLMAVLAFTTNFWYGSQILKDPGTGSPVISVALIQGNIPQSIKWEPTAQEQIVDIHMKLTELAAYEKPDLIVWPEASFPGYFNRDPEAGIVTEWFKHWKIPAVIGAPYYEFGKGSFNSAFYIGGGGEVLGRYDKMYLVPFGEYVPLKPVFGWLQPLAQSLGVSDFLSGKEFTKFKLESKNVLFSVLICFEDVFPSLARKFAGPEKQFLIVITNDAWFGPTAAPFQHLQASVFRAVENGLPIVRAANTGVSAFITNTGKVTATVRDDEGNETFIRGIKTDNITLARKETLFSKGGWLVPYAASAFLVVLALLRAIMGRPRRKTSQEEA